MKRSLIILLSLLCATMLFSTRRALIIGNSAYMEGPLKNPVNDAKAVAAKMKDLGFTVTLKTNLDKENMDVSIDDFIRSINSGDEILFYYSGHGVSVEGENYLIPTNNNFDSVIKLKNRASRAGEILELLKQRSEIAIIVLDACRDNPYKYTRDSGKGLAQMNTNFPNQYIIYSTMPGKTAADGEGSLSPFTTSFLANVSTGKKITDTVQDIARDLHTRTRGDQIPWSEGILLKDFYFTAATAPVTPVQGLSPNPKVKEPIRVSSADEFLRAIGSDRTIIIGDLGLYLDKASPNLRYSYTDMMQGNPELGLAPSASRSYYFDGESELVIYACKNLTIIGDEKNLSRLYTTDIYSEVITFTDCENITLKNIEAGHRPEYAHICAANVVSLENCTNINIENCVLFGCGASGLGIFSSSAITVRKTVIKECSRNAVEIANSHGIDFFNCEFRNIEEALEILNIGYSRDVNFYHCDIYNNQVESFIYAPEPSERNYDKLIRIENCLIHDNQFEYPVVIAPNIQLNNNVLNNNRLDLVFVTDWDDLIYEK